MCKACRSPNGFVADSPNSGKKRGTRRPQRISNLKEKRDNRTDVVIVVNAGESFTARDGQVFRAEKGAYVVAKRGSKGDFLTGSSGVAEKGSMYTAWNDSVVHGKYGSVGTARKGAKLVLTYGAELAFNYGAKITWMGDDEDRLVDGARVAPISSLSVEERALVDAAWEASTHSYSPYSEFPVGAAIRARNDKGEVRIFAGSNIENASYGGTVCAERVAAFAAVFAGFTQIEMVAVVCAKCPGGSPCGLCRQVLREFGLNKKTGLNATVLNVFNRHTVVRWNMEALLPDSFGPDSL